ncbi:MAG TPA: zinc metalloprotease HtpX [Vicinamibacterales bacterium]
MSNGIKTALLLGSLSGLLLMAGQLIGGTSGLIVAFGFAVVMNFFSYWFSDRIVLRMYKAQEVGPAHPLHQMTARLAERANLPMPKVYVIPSPSPNAFATGRNPAHAAVAATEGIMQLLNEQELAGVMAHELAHVKHRDILTSSVAATIASAITMLGYMLYFVPIGRGDDDGDSSPLAAVAMMILAPLAAGLIQAAISRSREFAADSGGASIAGSPDGLANALRKLEAGSKRVPLDANPATAHMFIVKPFSAGGLMGLFSTHPPTEARIANLLGSGR